MAQNGLSCADVPLINYSLTQSLTHPLLCRKRFSWIWSTRRASCGVPRRPNRRRLLRRGSHNMVVLMTSRPTPLSRLHWTTCLSSTAPENTASVVTRLRHRPPTAIARRNETRLRRTLFDEKISSSFSRIFPASNAVSKKR